MSSTDQSMETKKFVVFSAPLDAGQRKQKFDIERQNFIIVPTWNSKPKK